MNFFKATVAILISIVIFSFGCVSVDNTAQVQKPQDSYNPDTELNVTPVLDNPIELKIEKALTIVFGPDIKENVEFIGLSSMEIDGVKTVPKLNILNFRSEIIKTVKDIFSNNMTVNTADISTGDGLELIIENAAFTSQGEVSINYSAKLNYSGETFTTLDAASGYVEWVDFPEYGWELNNWLRSQKDGYKDRIEKGINKLANSLYQGIFNNFTLKNSGFWSFPMLENDETINGMALKKGTNVVYDENGKLKGIVLKKDTDELMINGIVYQNGSYYDSEIYQSRDGIYFYPSGKLKFAKLKNETVFDKVSYSGDSQIYFHESGKVQSGEIKNDLTVNKLQFKGGYNIGFHENGNVSYGILTKVTTINGIKWAAVPADLSKDSAYSPEYYQIGFYENGKVSYGILAQKYGEFDVDDSVEIDEDGEMRLYECY